MAETDNKPIISVKTQVRWGEMDAYEHVNNAMYFRYMEEARIQLLHHLGGSLDPQSTGPVIVNAEAEFLAAVTYPDSLRIDCSAGELGRSSFMSYYRIYSEAQQGKLVCRGSAKVVWVDHRLNQSTPLPEILRQRIGQA